MFPQNIWLKLMISQQAKFHITTTKQEGSCWSEFNWISNSPLDVGWVWLFIFHISVLHYKKLLLNWYTEHWAPWLRKTSYVPIITYISQIKVVFGKFTIASILSNTRRGNTSINYYKHSSYSSHFHDQTQNAIMKMYHPIIQHFLIHYYLCHKTLNKEAKEMQHMVNQQYWVTLIQNVVSVWPRPQMITYAHKPKICICLAKAWDNFIFTLT